MNGYGGKLIWLANHNELVHCHYHVGKTSVLIKNQYLWHNSSLLYNFPLSLILKSRDFALGMFSQVCTSTSQKEKT